MAAQQQRGWAIAFLCTSTCQIICDRRLLCSDSYVKLLHKRLVDKEDKENTTVTPDSFLRAPERILSDLPNAQVCGTISLDY